MAQFGQKTSWTTSKTIGDGVVGDAAQDNKRIYDVVMGVNDIDSEQWGIVGKTMLTETQDRERTVCFDWNHVHCMSLMGAPGGGKSYTLGTLIEAALSDTPNLNYLPSPCCCLMIHYSESAEYAPEFNTMIFPNNDPGQVGALKKVYNAEPNPVSDLVIIAPKESLLKRRRENPHIPHHPFAFHPDEIQVSQWKMLMGANGEEGDYVNEIKLMLREHQDNLSVEVLREAIEKSRLNDSDKAKADQRLRTASNFIDARYGIKRLLKAGRLIVVDFRDELLELDEVCSLIVVLIQAFGDAKRFEIGGGIVNKDNPYARMLGVGRSEDEVWFEANEHNKRVQKELAEKTDAFMELQDKRFMTTAGLEWIGLCAKECLACVGCKDPDREHIIKGYQVAMRRIADANQWQDEGSLFGHEQQDWWRHQLTTIGQEVHEQCVPCPLLQICMDPEQWPADLGPEFMAFTQLAIETIAPFLAERGRDTSPLLTHLAGIITSRLRRNENGNIDYQATATAMAADLRGTDSKKAIRAPGNCPEEDQETLLVLYENIAHQAETFALIGGYFHDDSDRDFDRVINDRNPLDTLVLLTACIWLRIYRALGADLTKQVALLEEIEQLNKKIIKGSIVNKLVVADECHKYLKPEYKELIGAVEIAIREMRHKACSMLLASQDPPSIPKQILELSTHLIMHKMNAPSWLKHLQSVNAMLGELRPAMLGALKPGEGYVWATRASEFIYTNGVTKVKFRPRASQHGGATKTAVKGTGHKGA